MPLYEYECESCGRRFELIRKFSDAPLEKCPTCGGKVQKQASSPAIQFKGTGWYVTDYAKKSGSDGSKTDKKGSGGGGEAGTGEAGKSESGKSESDKTTKSADSGSSTESKSSTSTSSSTTDSGSKNS